MNRVALKPQPATMDAGSSSLAPSLSSIALLGGSPLLRTTAPRGDKGYLKTHNPSRPATVSSRPKGNFSFPIGFGPLLFARSFWREGDFQ